MDDYRDPASGRVYGEYKVKRWSRAWGVVSRAEFEAKGRGLLADRISSDEIDGIDWDGCWGHYTEKQNRATHGP